MNKRIEKDARDEKDEKQNDLAYYAHLSRTHNTTLSILLTLLAGYLAFIYLATTQRDLFTFWPKIVASIILTCVTAYASIRYYNSGYQKSKVEERLGLTSIIDEIGTKPEWLEDFSDKKRTFLQISILGFIGATVISIFYLATMWFVFGYLGVIISFVVLLGFLLVFCFSLIKNFKNKLLTTLKRFLNLK